MLVVSCGGDFEPGVHRRDQDQGFDRKPRAFWPQMVKRQEGMGRTLMLQGCASDVGKSVLTAAFCRILADDGWRVAPFKAQNMALNSFVTLEGGEIGRAQAMQAEAAGVAPHVDMNPILQKPVSDTMAQVIVEGVPIGNMTAKEYLDFKQTQGRAIVARALQRLRQRFDIVILEGGGSPAEVNLRQHDLVNMAAAEMADAPVVLIGDIDRGGVFAYLVGTMLLLNEKERARVKAVLINKFRGSQCLLEPGLRLLEKKISRPVLGVIPYFTDLRLPEEDAVGEGNESLADGDVDIAVLYLPHISNFTDFDPLAAEPGVRLRYVRSVRELGTPDVIFIPGTKNTMADLAYLRQSGWEEAIRIARRSGVIIGGICGGYQMLGRWIHDQDGVDGESPGTMAGMQLLDIETRFERQKATRQVVGELVAGFGPDKLGQGERIEGYEIHMGVSYPADDAAVSSLARIRDRYGGHLSGDSYRLDGAVSPDGLVFGTYVHGLFDQDGVRHCLLRWIRERKWSTNRQAQTVSWRQQRLEAYRQLADRVREAVDMDMLYHILGIKR